MSTSAETTNSLASADNRHRQRYIKGIKVDAGVPNPVSWARCCDKPGGGPQFYILNVRGSSLDAILLLMVADLGDSEARDGPRADARRVAREAAPR
jgi:hypothetical protein